jgi:uncharacterized protein involved in cysteine biosynthesis
MKLCNKCTKKVRGLSKTENKYDIWLIITLIVLLLLMVFAFIYLIKMIHIQMELRESIINSYISVLNNASEILKSGDIKCS